MIRSLSIKILSVLFIISFLFLAGRVLAETAESLKAKIELHNGEIDALEKEITTYQAQLNQIGKETKTLGNSIKELELTEKKLLTDIKVTENKIETANLNLEKLSFQIDEKSQDIGVNKDAISKIIRNMSENESATLIEGMLRNQKISDSWKEIDNYIKIQENIKEKVYVLKDAKQVLEEKKIQVEKIKAELSRLKNSLSDQKKIVEVNKKDKNKLLTQTKNQESNYKNILADRLKKKQAFEKELQAYESQLKFILDPKTLPRGGVLDWPLDYVLITQKFGKTTSSGRLYASGTHSGVDFRASTGTPVKALSNGVVVGYGDTDITCAGASFGKWILIDYGNGLTSAFGHMSLTKVSKGQRVSRGEVVGYSGNTGHSTAPHLHVTIYASSAVKVENRPSVACGGRSYTMPIAATNAYLDPQVYLPKASSNMYKNGAGDD